MVNLGILLGVPTELQHGHDNGQRKAAKEDDEHSADIFHAKGIGLGVLALVLENNKNLRWKTKRPNRRPNALATIMTP